MLIMKFGGASVAEPENFHLIADLILGRLIIDTRLAVVVSAMGNMTDQLLALSKKMHHAPPPRELDMLVSVGERISISLLAMALAAKGVEAVSFTGSQSGIITCESHTDAKIVDVRPGRLLPHLDRGKVVVVAGFQGVSRMGEITTLGRGGSDTTAVALAIALEAPRVEFYKDVSGIFTTDPKKDSSATMISSIDYKSAFALASAGAKVLHPRSIQLAEKNGVQLSVLSFKSPKEGGTLVGSGPRNSKKVYEIVG